MSLSAQARERDVRGAGVVTAALLSALLFSAGVKLPLLLPLSTLAPLPLTLHRLMRGAFSGLSSAVLAGLLVASAFSGEWGLRYAFYIAIPALLLGGQMARGRGLRRGCLLAFLWLASVIGVQLIAAGPELGTGLVRDMEQSSRGFLEGMRSKGLPPERVDEMAEQLDTMRTVTGVVYPAMLLITGALVVLANAALLRAYLMRRDPGWLDGGEFESLSWPLPMAVAFVLSGVLVVFPPLKSAAYNSLLLVSFFFALQGLAVVVFYAHRLAAPPFLRAAVVVLVLVNPWAPQLLALLGLFDTWFDFRKWAEPPQPADGRS
jgi:uncharacterized protein YybS (DUF2232 family)